MRTTAVAIFALAASAASATVIYTQDFEDPLGVEWSSSDTFVHSAETTLLGMFGSESVSLAVSTTAGAEYQLTYTLFAKGQFEGQGESHEDRFFVNVSGVTAMSEYIDHDHSSTAHTFAAPDTVYNASGGINRETVFRNVTVSFTAAADTTSIDFGAFVTSANERWAIDDVSITQTSTIPAPGAASVAAFAIVALGRRR